MRKTMTMLTLMSFIFVAACGGQDKQPLPEITDQERALAAASNDFGFELFAQLGTDAQDNVFISPLSVSMALGMTLNGARGDTLDAMQATL
ncbi:MAG: hypothetical protein JRF33_21505, partial [Deltaproteobacteria bacterium]|nr:hypothetical protein [Deltaproteobacteria bacterium]